jgi:hypothetical protein
LKTERGCKFQTRQNGISGKSCISSTCLCCRPGQKVRERLATLSCLFGIGNSQYLLMLDLCIRGTDRSGRSWAGRSGGSQRRVAVAGRGGGSRWRVAVAGRGGGVMLLGCRDSQYLLMLDLCIRGTDRSGRSWAGRSGGSQRRVAVAGRSGGSRWRVAVAGRGGGVMLLGCRDSQYLLMLICVFCTFPIVLRSSPIRTRKKLQKKISESSELVF